MRSVFTCTTLAIIVPLVFSQRPLAHYPENLKRAVPHHYKNDQENTHRGLDKIARWHKIEPPLPRLRPHQTVPWLRWVQGRWAAPADKNTELHKVRAHLLEEKLKPNHLVFKPHINPQLKPKLNKKENVRTKREVGKTEKETPQKETHVEVNVRHKRDLMMPQLVPEMVLQPHIQANIPQPRDQFEGEIKESEKREKRQILYFINRPPKLLARSPRTTPNPFIRDTHIEEYDIIRPEVGEREGMIPTIESGSSDLGSYPLVTFQKVLSDITKKLLILANLIPGRYEEVFTDQVLKVENEQREKRSPKMSKLKKKQKIEKKKRKKKKKKELSPRRIKHIRRKKEKKERRKRLHDKRLKEKRRLRHKKLGTGPYNKTITDYYGIYYDPPSVQLNESLYDSIYDTSEIDSDAIYEERMKERYDDYPESESTSEDSDAYYDEQIYGDTEESGDEGKEDDDRGSDPSSGSDGKTEDGKANDKQHVTPKHTSPHPKSKKTEPTD